MKQFLKVAYYIPLVAGAIIMLAFILAPPLSDEFYNNLVLYGGAIFLLGGPICYILGRNNHEDAVSRAYIAWPVILLICWVIFSYHLTHLFTF